MAQLRPLAGATQWAAPRVLRPSSSPQRTCHGALTPRGLTCVRESTVPSDSQSRGRVTPPSGNSSLHQLTSSSTTVQAPVGSLTTGITGGAWHHGKQWARLHVDFCALEAEIDCSGQAPVTYRSTGAIRCAL